MSKNRVIIASAGWKGAGHKDNLAGCPESFLPLGDGTTILSRTATVFAENDFEVYIATGPLGYPYSKYARWKSSPAPPQFDPDFPWGDSPWTQDRLDYAAQFGTVVEMPDPGGWSTHLDTFCEAMDIIGEENWDGLLLAPGDMVIPRGCLEYIIGLNRPCSLSLTAFHTYFFFDSPSARFFRDYSEPFRRFETEKEWKYNKDKSPNHQGSVVLRKEAGFKIYGRNNLPRHKWTDIDTFSTYRDACNLIGVK